MLSAMMMNLKFVIFSELFKLTKSTKRKKIISDEIIREIQDAQELIARRDDANNENQIYHIYDEILDEEVNQFDQEIIFRIIS